MNRIFQKGAAALIKSLQKMSTILHSAVLCFAEECNNFLNIGSTNKTYQHLKLSTYPFRIVSVWSTSFKYNYFTFLFIIVMYSTTNTLHTTYYPFIKRKYLAVNSQDPSWLNAHNITFPATVNFFNYSLLRPSKIC